MGNFHERGKHAPLSLVMRASSRMLLLSRQSLSHQTFSHQGKEKKNLLSFRHTGQAANSHSTCQYNVSPSKISHSAYSSPHPSVGLQAASWLGCTETRAADHLQSPCLPGTCFLLHAPAEAHCKLAVSAWGQLSESNSLSVNKNLQFEWFLPL